jgi:UDP-2,3-diacylglucosamine pyrophosphatase LpxH
MAKDKRKVNVVVLSDIHLGTYACHAKELLKYLKGIKPKILVLNGDIIDIWQFSKRYWPKPHMKVIKYIIGMAANGTKTYYVTGNHDELLRKFEGFKLGSLEVVNKLVLELDGKKAWFFHGDVFDVVMQNTKWLAKAGAIGYDLLIHVNTFVNYISRLFGRGKISLSKKIKDNVKSAVKYINNFEETAARMAISKGYSHVICGHIHHAEIRMVNTPEGGITYMNSGDWVESLTALEYHKKKWTIYHYPVDKIITRKKIVEDELDDFEEAMVEFNNKELFRRMLKDFNE